MNSKLKQKKEGVSPDLINRQNEIISLINLRILCMGRHTFYVIQNSLLAKPLTFKFLN